MAKTQIVNDEGGEPIAVEILANDIQAIAAAMRKINDARITRRAILVLIAANSKLPMTTIDIVLNNLTALENIYLKPKR